VRTGSPITRRGRTDGAGEGLRGPNPDRTHIWMSLGKRGPIPPCPTLLRTERVAAVLRGVGRTGSPTTQRGRTDGAGAGQRGAQSRPNIYMDGPWVKVGPIPPCPNECEDRESHQRDAKNGWRGGGFEGRAIPPQQRGTVKISGRR